MVKCVVDGGKFRGLREKFGLLQYEMGEVLGVSPSYLSSVESGATSPSSGFVDGLVSRGFVGSPEYFSSKWSVGDGEDLTFHNLRGGIVPRYGRGLGVYYFERASVVDLLEADYGRSRVYGYFDDFGDLRNFAQSVRSEYVTDSVRDNRLLYRGWRDVILRRSDDEALRGMAVDVATLLQSGFVFGFSVPSTFDVLRVLGVDGVAFCSLSSSVPVVLVSDGFSGVERDMAVVKQLFLWMVQEDTSGVSVRWDKLGDAFVGALVDAGLLSGVVSGLDSAFSRARVLAEGLYGRFYCEVLGDRLGFSVGEVDLMLGG